MVLWPNVSFVSPKSSTLESNLINFIVETSKIETFRSEFKFFSQIGFFFFF